MKNSRLLILAAFVGLTVVGSGCTQKSADEARNATGDAIDKTKAATDDALDKTKEGAATAIDETQKAGEKTAEATRNVAEKTVDKTKEIAGKTVDKTKEIAGSIANKTKKVSAATGEVISDAWITAKLKTKFADETLLKGSNINVDTDDYVVTLKGTVASAAAKDRAATIARGTEGVSRVVNQLVVN